MRPRISLSGVSGLSTLLSGNYIGFEAGATTKKERTFTGLEVPPIITGGSPGRQFVLLARDLGSLGISSPVYYRRLQVGQVVAYDLAPDGKSVVLRIFVNAPYDKYVTADTRFWNASGVDVSLTTNGLDVRPRVERAARRRHRIRGAGQSDLDCAGRGRHRSRCSPTASPR